MYAREHRFRPAKITLDQGQMRALLHFALIGIYGEIAESGGQMRLVHIAYGNLTTIQAVTNNVLHCRYLEAMLFGKDFQIGHARHSAVIAHDLADNRGGLEPCHF